MMLKKSDQVISATKRIAIVAHDNEKKSLMKWAKDKKEILQNHMLCGSGTTASLLQKTLQLPVQQYNSGPFGGDLQIGADISEGKIDLLLFLWDPLTAQPHDPDVKALLRIAVLYNIPIANNLATADFLLTSHYMGIEYTRETYRRDTMLEERISMFEESIG